MSVLIKPTFAQKMSLHIVVLVLVTGISVTLMTAGWFRQKLYEQEFAKAYTTYMAAANYLAGHYRSHRETFNRRILSYVLGEKFMNLPGADPAMMAHRLTRLVIYSTDGTTIFEFSRSGENAALKVLPKELLPTVYRHWHSKLTQSIHVAGPIESEGEIPGYLEIQLPTTIDAEVEALYRKSFYVLSGIMVLAIVVSVFFARRHLAPIEDLTAAAREVHNGKLDQRVRVRTSDEVGMLAETFNEMTGSIARRVAMNRQMQEWTMRIGGEFEPRRLVPLVSQMFTSMSGGAACRVFLVDPSTGKAAAWRVDGAAPTDDDQPDDVSTRAVATNALAMVQQGDLTVTEVAIPMSVGDRVVGVARLGKRSGGGVYSEELIAPLMTMGQHAASAIENLRMHRELAARERMEQEMKWARDIQRSMLPRKVPVIPGFEACGRSYPAFEVGGDYFDYVQSDGRWFVVVGDVSGKGVPAALIMSMLRSLIHTNAETSASPRDVLRRVNRLLTPDLETEMFVTVAAATTDSSTGALRVVRAGHEPFLVVRSTGAIEWVSPEGTALGLVEIDEFEGALRESTIEMGEGDTLLMFTDGMTETFGPGGQELGYERIGEIFSRHRSRPIDQLVDAAIGDLRAYAEGGEQSDDITVVALRRNRAS